MDTGVKRILLLLCTLGLTGFSFVAIAQPYAIAVSPLVFLLCGGFCLLFGIPLLLPGAWRLTALLPLGALTYGVWRFLPQLLLSLPLLGNQYMAAANDYHQYQWLLPFEQNQLAQPFLGVLALGLIISLLICIGALLFRSVIFTALPLALGLALGVFTNQFPPLWAAFGAVLLLGFLCLLLVQKQKGRSAPLYICGLSIITALALCSAFIAPSIALQLPASAMQLQSIQTKLINTWQQGQQQTAQDTPLSNNSLRFTGRTVLTLQAQHKPLEDVFLRERSYGTYQGGAWGALPQAAFDQFATDTSITGQEIAGIDYTALASMGAPTTTLDIQRYDGGGALAPYNFMPQTETPDTYFLGDGHLISTQAPLHLKGFWLNTDPWDGDTPLTYDQFAQAHYLAVPNLPRLAAMASKLERSFPQDIYAEITQVLAASASYSLDIPQADLQGDYIENFLFVQKSGYCQHFASAATLLFRYKGIPARYVTGYSVPQSSFIKNANGYTANVQDAMAHAWTEIYLRGKGWFPLEVTPSGVQEQLRALPTPVATPVAEPSQSLPPALVQQTPRATPIAPTTAAVTGAQPQLQALLLPLVLVPVFLWLCAITARTRRRRIATRRSASPTLLLTGLLHMLEFGLNEKQGRLSDRDFIEKALVKLQVPDGNTLALLLEKHSFSSIPVNEAEQDTLNHIYARCKKALRPTLSPFKKQILDWIYCY